MRVSSSSLAETPKEEKKGKVRGVSGLVSKSIFNFFFFSIFFFFFLLLFILFYSSFGQQKTRTDAGRRRTLTGQPASAPGGRALGRQFCGVHAAYSRERRDCTARMEMIAIRKLIDIHITAWLT